MSATAVTGVRPEFGFTRHAVFRFRQRVRPDLDDREALRLLADVADQAVLLPRRTRFGQAIWRVESPAMRWITKPDNGATVVVTILDGASGGEDEAEQEVLDAHKRLASEDPELATPTRPTAHPRCCGGHAAAWLDLETKRLEVERRRIETIAAATANSAKMMETKLEKARLGVERAQAEAQRQAAAKEARKIKNAASNVHEGHRKALQRRHELLSSAVERLRAVDAEGSADLLVKIERVLRKSAKGSAA